jgi:hypothetical protein
MKRFTVIVGLVTVLLGSGCTVVRVLTHYDSFSKLDPQVRKQVLRGRVELGYNQASVLLALGRPNYRNIGSTGTTSNETWNYTGMDVTSSTAFSEGSPQYANETPTINLGWVTFTEGKVAQMSRNFSPDSSEPRDRPIP